jgi:TetR/AcrR family transcriptional regulator, tetracycline repressor protein
VRAVVGERSAPRAAVAGVALVSGGPVEVRGNPGDAMRRLVQEVMERVLAGHRPPSVSLSVIGTTLSPIEWLAEAVTLDRQRIVAEAIALLDADGLEGVTLRKLAVRLGVRQPTLYWHLPNKAALITAIADAILEEELAGMAPPGPDERWQDWLIGLAERLRLALLAHPDGARVISASQLSVRMAAFSELAFSTLVARGVPLRQARLIVLAVEHFTVGHILEEQTGPPDADAVKGFDLAAFTATYPTVVAGISEYFHDGRTVDDLFRDCVTLIVDGPPARDDGTGRPGAVQPR